MRNIYIERGRSCMRFHHSHFLSHVLNGVFAFSRTKSSMMNRLIPTANSTEIWSSSMSPPLFPLITPKITSISADPKIGPLWKSESTETEKSVMPSKRNSGSHNFLPFRWIYGLVFKEGRRNSVTTRCLKRWMIVILSSGKKTILFYVINKNDSIYIYIYSKYI